MNKLLIFLIFISTFSFAKNFTRITISPSVNVTDDKSLAINNAIKQVRELGGGEIIFKSGVYQIYSPILIQTDVEVDNSGNEILKFPFYIKLVGNSKISNHTNGNTIFKWQGSNKDQAVIEITHAQNTTIKNIRIQAGAGKRFKQGIFFHRTDSAITGTAKLPAPTNLNVYDSGISRGEGNFTIGLQLNDPGSKGEFDQNVDMNHIENFYVDGATDDTNGIIDNYYDCLNSSGIVIFGSQVQAGYFRNINVNNSGTGVFVRNGQLEIFGGTFSNNIQPAKGAYQCLADDNHASGQIEYGNGETAGGGDFVFRTMFGGGHIISNIVSQNSYRFFSSFLEDYNKYPHTGNNADWQGSNNIAISFVADKIYNVQDPQGYAVHNRAFGGPLSFVQTEFGGNQAGVKQKIYSGKYTQASIYITESKFNHAGPFFVNPTYDSLVERPKLSITNSTYYNGTKFVTLPSFYSDTNDKLATKPFSFKYVLPRSMNEKPTQPSRTLDLGSSFTLDGKTYTAKSDYEDFDNGVVINAAIEYMRRLGGGTILFPNGVYDVKTQILLNTLTNIKLQGIGGKQGALHLGPGLQTKGTALVWGGDANQTMMLIDHSTNIVIEGLAFSTEWNPNVNFYHDHIDTFINVRNSSSNIWFENIMGGWLGGNFSEIKNRGVSKTFIKIGSGSASDVNSKITLLNMGGIFFESECLLIDGPSTNIHLLQFAPIMSKRAIRTTANGGEFYWYGGGGGNTLKSHTDPSIESIYDDPVIVELGNITGNVILAGQELQDNYPTKFIRTSNVVPSSVSAGIYIYGVDVYLFAPKLDQKQIEINFTKGPASQNYYAMTGTYSGNIDLSTDPRYDFAKNPPLIYVSNGSSFYSFANAHPIMNFLESKFSYDSLSFIQDASSKAEYRGSYIWGYKTPIMKLFNSNFGLITIDANEAPEFNKPFHLKWNNPSTAFNLQNSYAAVYTKPGAQNSDYVEKVSLQDINGNFASSGVTKDTVTITNDPMNLKMFEIRYFINGYSEPFAKNYIKLP